MDVVVVGAGMAGLLLARALRDRGLRPVVLERAPAHATVPGPIMLPYQAYDALADVGVLERIRAAGRDIAPGPDGTPVAIAVARQEVMEALREGVPVRHETTLGGLARDGFGRVVGVRVARAGAEEVVPTHLVVGADGARSLVRELAGIAAQMREGGFAGLSFRSPVVLHEPFAMAYQSDGRQVTCVSWPGGTAGTFQVDPMGAEAALAPGLGAFRRAFAALLPAAAPALAALTEADWFYREGTEVRCPRWWAPGAVLIGEAAHAINPETGVGSGLGFGDGLALAVAVAHAGDDPDGACREYERWRRPAVAPYERLGVAGTRLAAHPAASTPGTQRPAAERWPPA